MSATESHSDTPSAGRLVIRVKLVPQEEPQLPAPRRSSKGALLIAGAVAVALTWLGFSMFGPEPASNAGAVVQDEPLPKPAIETTATSSAESTARSVEPEPRQQPDAPPSAVNEVMPDVSRSALDTITGTIRVSVRVTFDKQGTVVDAALDDAGPSRYFARRSVEASKKWTFTPANSEDRRTMLVRFNFTRSGVTAQASSPQ